VEVKGISVGCHTICFAHRQDSTGVLHHFFDGQSSRALQIGSDLQGRSDNYPKTLSFIFIFPSVWIQGRFRLL